MRILRQPVLQGYLIPVASVLRLQRKAEWIPAELVREQVTLPPGCHQRGIPLLPDVTGSRVAIGIELAYGGR